MSDKPLTADEFAEVLFAGVEAIPSKSEPAANALALARDAMAEKAVDIARREGR